MTHLHLAPGSSLLHRSDALLLASPDEQFAAITGTPAELTAVNAVLQGTHPVPGAGLAADIAAAVTEWGVANWSEERRTPADATKLADHLPPLAATLTDADLVVNDVLDDEALGTRDALSGQRPWLPLHRELGALVIGPVIGASSGLTWADVRFRRLAASPTRPQLQALWQAWSDGTAHDILPTAASLATGLARLFGWLSERPGVLTGHQVTLRLDSDAAPSTHPVLAVPQGLMERMATSAVVHQ